MAKNINSKVKIVILAAGKGKRMQSDLPKVLVPLHGKPMIRHILDSLQEIFSEKPVAIVGHKGKLVREELGELTLYVDQKEQLGTGHAVSCAEGECKDAEHIVVLSGDQPFIKAETVKNLISRHLETGAKITLATTELTDFRDWRAAFKNFGRVLRQNGEVVGITEYKDATDEEKNIMEVNTGTYVFDAEWLWKNLKRIKNENAQGEYYLTDLLQIAFIEGAKIEALKIYAKEALGANSKEELEILEKFV
jgi:bifunctional UDP-N-acetylglucosamine pyrophosphorylase / glucosamine-1-phosphate N-acetyltransferase